MSKDKSSICFGLGLFAGVIGGIIAGVLYAPCPGSEMREKVKDTVCDLAEKHSPAINEAKKQALESIDLLKYKLEKKSEYSVIESDEAYLEKIYDRYDADYLLVTNLFRDQLDRYGELATTKKTYTKRN